MPKDISEILVQFIFLVIGIYIIFEVSKNLNIEIGALIVGFFILIGIFIILKESGIK